MNGCCNQYQLYSLIHLILHILALRSIHTGFHPIYPLQFINTGCVWCHPVKLTLCSMSWKALEIQSLVSTSPHVPSSPHSLLARPVERAQMKCQRVRCSPHDMKLHGEMLQYIQYSCAGIIIVCIRKGPP